MAKVLTPHPERFARSQITQASKRVAKGCAVLDKRVAGWERKVTLSDLDLSDGSCCVLGQLVVRNVLAEAPSNVYDAYGVGVVALALDGVDFGFCDHAIYASYRLLDELWAEAIRQRRAGRKVTATSLRDAFRDDRD